MIAAAASVTMPAMRIRRIHHMTLAVRDLDEARATFEAIFGAEASPTRQIPAFGIEVASLRLGDDELELASTADPDNPLRRFLERKGEGFYNVAVEVEGLDDAVAELAAKGVRVSQPVESEPGVRAAFVTMAATHGLSVQLIEIAGDIAADIPESDADAKSPLDLTPDEWSDTD
jgi:methylmalonyl-CoA/ethylmalonyl-CoA epimerase